VDILKLIISLLLRKKCLTSFKKKREKMDWPFQKAEESNVYKTPLCRHIASMG
jgi:hypothetical protein